MAHNTKHSKTEKLLVTQRFIPGSLWICNKPYWYFYNYDPAINMRWVHQSTRKRQIKYLQQKRASDYTLDKEVMITVNDPLTLISKTETYYKFKYKNNEIIDMRGEFIYKFVEDWTSLTWEHNQ